MKMKSCFKVDPCYAAECTGYLPIEIWATPNTIMSEMFCGFLIAEVFQRIWP